MPILQGDNTAPVESIRDIKQIVKEEYKKCAEDPVYFFRRFATIQHPMKGRLNFNLFTFQERVLKELMTHDYNIILKSRQMGISTLTAGYALWTMTFNADKNILVIATKQEVAKNLITKVRYMYDNLPSWLKVECVEDNKLNLKLSNGSQVKAASSSADSGRSEAVSMLVIDEAAFINNVEEIWGSAQQTLATGGRAIVLSTPNGTGNWFHKQWVDSEAGHGFCFNTIRLHWSMHPERDKAWREAQEDILGKRLAAQECDADFQTSGNTVISPEVLSWYRSTYVKAPIEKRYTQYSSKSDLWIWEYPDRNKSYVVSADVARGDGEDSSAFHIINIETLEQVAEFKGLISTKDFGDLLVNISTEYCDAILVIENANIGWATLQQVIDRGYKNLYYTKQNIKYVDPNRQSSNKLQSQDKKSVAGFSTTPSTRPLIIAKLEEYFRERSVMVRSSRLMDELDVFIYTGSGVGAKAEAANGYNDDLVLSLAIALWVRDTSLQLISQNVQLQKSMMHSFTVSRPFEQVNSIYTAGMISAESTWTQRVGRDAYNLTELLPSELKKQQD